MFIVIFVISIILTSVLTPNTYASHGGIIFILLSYIFFIHCILIGSLFLTENTTTKFFMKIFIFLFIFPSGWFISYSKPVQYIQRISVEKAYEKIKLISFEKKDILWNDIVIGASISAFFQNEPARKPGFIETMYTNLRSEKTAEIDIINYYSSCLTLNGVDINKTSSGYLLTGSVLRDGITEYNDGKEIFDPATGKYFRDGITKYSIEKYGIDSNGKFFIKPNKCNSMSGSFEGNIVISDSDWLCQGIRNCSGKYTIPDTNFTIELNPIIVEYSGSTQVIRP